MATTAKKRIRKSRNVTLNPVLVDRLRMFGSERANPETNLSRLIDEAMSNYLGNYRGPKPSK